MTEQEAKTKACCMSFSLQGVHPSVAGQTTFTTFEPRNCIGSACMAWRWDSVGMEYEHAGYGGKDKGKGHCGLAGKP